MPGAPNGRHARGSARVRVRDVVVRDIFECASRAKNNKIVDLSCDTIRGRL